jgi:hypothetical protein
MTVFDVLRRNAALFGIRSVIATLTLCARALLAPPPPGRAPGRLTGAE